MKNKFLASTIMFSLVLSLLGMASVSSAQVATISAGSNQTITLPASTVTLTGIATASAGSLIAGYNWVQTSGPVSSVIASPSLASTSVSGLTAAGNYVFTFTASDNSTPAQNSSSAVTVTVNSATPLPPIKTIKSKLEINSNGKVNLQGELMSVGTGTLAVKVWGITFNVNTTNAQWNGKVLNVSDYKVGDMISVNGKIDTTASAPTIIARNVKNMTAQALKERDEKAAKLYKNFGQKMKEKKMEDRDDKKGNDDR